MEQLIAVIGAGGKTTAMGLLARQSGKQAVLVTTTTHIFPMEPPSVRLCLVNPTAEALAGALRQPGVLCAGASAPQGKLGMLPGDVLEAGLAAAALTVYEGDGSRGCPLKLHREREPVLLPRTGRCLILAGLSALGEPVGQAIHRYEREPEWKKHPQKPVGVPELIRCVLETARASGLPARALRVFLNQADALAESLPAMEAAGQLNALGLKTRWGSLRSPPPDLYDWVISE